MTRRRNDSIGAVPRTWRKIKAQVSVSHPLTWALFVSWNGWARTVSNRRHPPCKGGALPLSYVPGRVDSLHCPGQCPANPYRCRATRPVRPARPARLPCGVRWCPPARRTERSRCVWRTNRPVCSSLPGGRLTPGRADHSTGEGCDGDTFAAVHAVCAMRTATTSPPCRFRARGVRESRRVRESRGVHKIHKFREDAPSRP